MGDAWMCLPALVDRCRENEIDLVCGSYALPIWEWGIKHLVGANYRIVRVINDPDDPKCEFCPGFGFIAMSKALAMVRAEMPGETVWGHQEIGSAYGYSEGKPEWYLGIPSPLELRGIELWDGDAVVVHPYTRHDWKNVSNVIGRVLFNRPVKIVGLPGEFEAPHYWNSTTCVGFDEMVRETLQSAGFVGVLSSFTNLAAIFGKKQVIVSFTSDIPITNERAVKLVCPNVDELQAACVAMGF